MSASEWPYPVSEFECHRCGNCCRGEGYVELTAEDVEALARHLGLTEAALLERYTARGEDGAPRLVNSVGPELACVFLAEDNTCRVHAAKPAQCRDFPMRWRPQHALEYCAGLRAAAGLPAPVVRTIRRPGR